MKHFNFGLHYRMKNKFYVYVHRRETDGRIFYVGKGKGNRAGQSHGRNKYWKNVAQKHGWFWEKPYENLTEACAHSIEKMLIHSIGKGNLTNICDGGEGFSGGKLSERSRAIISEKSRKWQRENPEKVAASARKRIATQRSNGFLAKLSVQKSNLYADWMERELQARRAGTSKIRLAHPVHGELELYQFEWVRKMGLHYAGIYKVLSGCHKHHHGWKIPSSSTRLWIPHFDFTGQPMRYGEFREPFPMQEEVSYCASRLSKPQYNWLMGMRPTPAFARAKIKKALTRKGIIKDNGELTEFGEMVVRHFSPEME